MTHKPRVSGRPGLCKSEYTCTQLIKSHRLIARGKQLDKSTLSQPSRGNTQKPNGAGQNRDSRCGCTSVDAEPGDVCPCALTVLFCKLILELSSGEFSQLCAVLAEPPPRSPSLRRWAEPHTATLGELLHCYFAVYVLHCHGHWREVGAGTLP